MAFSLQFTKDQCPSRESIQVSKPYNPKGKTFKSAIMCWTPISFEQFGTFAFTLLLTPIASYTNQGCLNLEVYKQYFSTTLELT